jgi:flagellar biosynthesis protein FliR
LSAGLLDLVPVLPALRVLAVATAFPLLAGPGTPRMVRLGVGLSLAVLVLHSLKPGPALSVQALLLVVPFELLLGLALGYVFSLPFDMLAVAGDLLGQEMGLNTATQFDPVTGRAVPLLARLFEIIGLVVFVEAGGMQLLLRTLEASFHVIPPGSIADPPRLFAALVESSTHAIAKGVELALPVAAVLMVITVATTFIARSVPKLHVMDFAYAARLMLALLLVALLLPRLVPAFSRFSDDMASRFLSALVGR